MAGSVLAFDANRIRINPDLPDVLNNNVTPVDTRAALLRARRRSDSNNAR